MRKKNVALMTTQTEEQNNTEKQNNTEHKL